MTASEIIANAMVKVKIIVFYIKYILWCVDYFLSDWRARSLAIRVVFCGVWGRLLTRFRRVSNSE